METRKVASFARLLTAADSLYVDGADRARLGGAVEFECEVERRSSGERFGDLRMKGLVRTFSL